MHLEEDTARLTHKTDASGESYSLIDMNRSGVPLMEIVSEPDMRSAEEARAYLVKLQRTLRYIGVSKVNLEEGNFRCDANVSLRVHGKLWRVRHLQATGTDSVRRQISIMVRLARELA